MVAVIQRVSSASVSVSSKIISKIQQGLLVLIGVEEVDGGEDIDWLSKKITNLRIFSDDNGAMNKSLIDIGGEILIVSQFTLHASTKKGNRPSYIKAAKPEIAIPIYKSLLDSVQDLVSSKVKTGEFGADMAVSLINDGPVTIIIDTKNKQ